MSHVMREDNRARTLRDIEDELMVLLRRAFWRGFALGVLTALVTCVILVWTAVELIEWL